MFPFELEPMLSGLLVGITFGLLFGISREERIKYISVSVFGAIVVAFLEINIRLYGYSLDVFYEFLIWSCAGFIVMSLLGLDFRKREDKSSGAGVVNMKLLISRYDD